MLKNSEGFGTYPGLVPKNKHASTPAPLGLGVLRVALASLRWVASRAVGGRDMGHGVMKSGQDEGIRTANNEPTVPRDVLSVCTEIRTRRLHRVTRL